MIIETHPPGNPYKKLFHTRHIPTGLEIVPYQEKDLNLLTRKRLQWSCDPTITKWIQPLALLKDSRSAEYMLIDNIHSPIKYYFLLIAAGMPIGQLALNNINWSKQSCTRGLFLETQARGIGYGKIAAQASVLLANKLGIQTIETEVNVKNTISNKNVRRDFGDPVGTLAETNFYKMDTSKFLSANPLISKKFTINEF